MAPRVTKHNLSWRLSFRLSEAALQRFWSIFAELGIVKTSATIVASDGSKLEFDVVHDVAAFPNAPDRSVEELSISGYLDPNDFNSNLLARFESDPSGRNVRLLLEGPDEWVLRARRDIEEWIRANRTPYAPIAEVEWFVPLLTLALSVSLWGIAFFLHGAGSAGFTKSSAVGWIGGLILGACLSPAFGWLQRGFRLLFPLGVFTFGVHGEEREARRAWWRMTVGGSVLLGLIVNLIAAAVFTWAQ